MRYSMTRRIFPRLLACALMNVSLLVFPMGTASAAPQTLTVDTPAPPTLGVPTIATSGSPTDVTAGSMGVVDPAVSLSGFDTIDGATVSINSGFVPSEDQLTFTNQNGIAGTYNSATGVLTLRGSASSAAYQAALQSVAFRNTDPNSSHLDPRTITFSVGAGTLFNAATGHFYQFVVSPGISWTGARDAAAISTLYGLRGYLATITSAAENSFVTAKLQGTGWIGASDSAQEGVWKWVTGPEAGTHFSRQSKYGWCAASTGTSVNGQYVHWAAGEPNDCGSNYPGNHAEDYAHFYTNGTWNDYPGNAGVEGYVVEYGGMAGDSQPVLSANATVNVVDGAAPTITGTATPAPNAAGWNNGEVAVHFTCSDAGSGLASCTPDSVLENEGANQSVTGSAVDHAGNTASATVSGINIDRTAPNTTISTWLTQDVPVTLAATDNLSGVAATYYTVDGGALQSGTLTIDSEGAHTITYWSVDAAGNAEAAQTATVQIDKTAPTISGSADRDANGAGWYNADVTVSFTCADDLSGVASCSQPQTLNEGANQSATGDATDNAGNAASVTVSGINVDKTAPTVTYSGNAGSYGVDQQVAINCTAGDSLSGVASSSCEEVSAPAYTFALGENTFSATAIDIAGNEATNTVSFTVSVTNLSLCSMTKQFVSNKGIANSLCVKLENAAKEAAAGNTEPAMNMLQAYINEVAAQSGKALSAERAEILTRLATALSN